MALLDHFHAPVIKRRSWEGFHGLWAAAMVETLNRDVLGDEYYADMRVHIGSQVEVDIATLAENGGQPGAAGHVGTGSTSTLTVPAWSPPVTDLILPIVFPDDIEVQVFATDSGTTLVGAVELVCPGNKDRTESRRAFTAKCVSYLTRGIGLVVVDIVTNRLANLHNEVVALLGDGGPYLLDSSVTTYAAGFGGPDRSLAPAANGGRPIARTAAGAA